MSALLGPIAQHYVPSADFDALLLSYSPLFYLKLGESSGTVAADDLGVHNGSYDNSPTLGQAGLLPNTGGTSVLLNGTNQSVTVPNFSGMNVSDFTLLIWAKWTTTGNSLVLAGRDSSTAARGFSLSTKTGGDLAWGNFGSGFAQTSGAGLNDGNSHMLMGNRDGTAGAFDLFVDGAHANGPATFANSQSSGNALWIGKRGNGTLWFPGYVQRVALIPSKLVLADAAALWAAA